MARLVDRRRVAATLAAAVASLASLAVPLAAPAQAPSDRASERTKLADARALWRERGVRDYRFRLTVRCFCPDAGRPTTVTVRNGRARGASGFGARVGTFQRMFARIQRALDDPAAGAVVVRYDRRRGFPRSASIDQVKLAIDDEIGWTVDRFRPLPRRRAR